MKSPPTLTSVASGARKRNVTVRSCFTSQEAIGGGALPRPPTRVAGALCAFNKTTDRDATRTIRYMAELYTQSQWRTPPGVLRRHSCRRSRNDYFAAQEKFAASSVLPD